MKFEKPKARTHTPVRRLWSVSPRENSLAKRGNIGPMDKADSTATKRNRNWVVITPSRGACISTGHGKSLGLETGALHFQRRDQFKGSLGSFEGCGESLICNEPLLVHVRSE